MNLNAFEQLEWNENKKVVRFSLDPIPRSLSLRYAVANIV